MHLRVSIFLLFLLLTGGFSLVCYNCQGPQGSPCGEQMTCDSESKCASRRILEYGSSEYDDEVKETTETSCAKPDDCESWSFSTGYRRKSVSVQCCDTDLCNEQYDPDFYLNYLDLFNLDERRCFTCDEEDCSHTESCWRDENYCFTAKGNQYHLHTVKGCASKHICDDPLKREGLGENATCCWGYLCNGAQSVTQSFLFLCCSLLSFILLH